MAALYTLGSGKAEMMVTRPQTLGYSLADSPAGLAAWFYDKFADWTYSDGDPERSLTKDEMLDDISLYWFTGTCHPSARLYWENNASNFNAVDISLPAAVTVFPGEIYRALRSCRCERAYHKLVYCHQPTGAATSLPGPAAHQPTGAATSPPGNNPACSPPRSVPPSDHCYSRESFPAIPGGLRFGQGTCREAV